MKIIGCITYENKYPENIQQDLVFNSNALNVIDLYCVDEDENLVDITDATVIFIVKENPTDADSSAVINKEITDLTNPTSGETLIEIEPSECDELLGNYVYELRISLVETGNEYILRQGNICFKKSIYGIES